MSCSKSEISDKAHQPLNFSFPQREFGKSSVVKRSFQAQASGSIGGHSYITMLIGIKLSAFCVSWLTRIITKIIIYYHNFFREILHIYGIELLERSLQSSRIHCIHVGDKYLGLNLRKMIVVRELSNY